MEVLFRFIQNRYGLVIFFVLYLICVTFSFIVLSHSPEDNASNHTAGMTSQNDADERLKASHEHLFHYEPNPSLRKWRNMECRKCAMPEVGYIIENPDRCSDKKLDMVFIINSHHTKYLNRKAIRETWGQRATLKQFNVEYVFLLGINENTEFNNQVKVEQAQYGDIVQGDFADRYNNLSMKTLMGFRWVSTHCKHAAKVFKTDDDMFMNLWRMRTEVLPVRAGNVIRGNCFGSGYPHRCVRSKWYTSYRSYPHTWYGPFCLGAVLIMSNEVAGRMYQASRSVPYFSVEDVYISSLTARAARARGERIGGITYSELVVDDCPSKIGNFASLLDNHKQFYELWERAKSQSCTKKLDVLKRT